MSIDNFKIKTADTDPNHHTVGHLFGGPDSQKPGGAIWYCDSYDPRMGYWMTRCDDPSRRTNVSERAIGRSFHTVYGTVRRNLPEGKVMTLRCSYFPGVAIPKEWVGEYRPHPNDVEEYT